MTSSLHSPTLVILLTLPLVPLGLGILRHQRWVELRRSHHSEERLGKASGWLASAWPDRVVAGVHALALVIAFRRVSAMDATFVELGLSSIRSEVFARLGGLGILTRVTCFSLSASALSNAIAWVGRRRLNGWRHTVGSMSKDGIHSASARHTIPNLALLSIAVSVIVLGLMTFGHAVRQYLAIPDSNEPNWPALHRQLMLMRPMLDRSALVLAIALVFGAVLAFLSSEMPKLARERAEATHPAKPWKAASSTTAALRSASTAVPAPRTLSTGSIRAALLIALGASGTAVLTWLTRPFAAENRDPLPSNYDFADSGVPMAAPMSQPSALSSSTESVAASAPVSSAGAPPHADTLQPCFQSDFRSVQAGRCSSSPAGHCEGTPLLTPERGRWLLDGVAVDRLSLLNALHAKRTLSGEGSAPATRENIHLRVAAEMSIELLREALVAIRQAGYATVSFCIASVLRLNRPVLGPLLAQRKMTLRTSLGLTRHACQQHSVPIRLPLAHNASTDDTLHRLASLQSAGHSPCIVTGSDPCPGPDDAQSACRARRTDGWEILAETEPSAPIEAIRLQHAGVSFDAVIADPQSIRIAHFDKHGHRLGSFDALQEHVDSQGEELLMAMNAGMFTPSYGPAGLLISYGRRMAGLNLADGRGNFHMKPNGVFLVGSETAGVFDSQEAFSQHSILGATQSGPLILRGGREHPAFRPESTSRHIRNAVGVQEGRAVVFVISNVPVTFHELAQAFTVLGCSDALYLDGSISRMYLPALDRHELGGAFGPMIAVTRPH